MAEKRDAGMVQRLERVETKVDRLGEKIDAHARRYDVQIEHVRDDIRRLAESVGSVIERLDRQHAESQAQTATRFADHELVLRDHGRRITALEPPRS
jgi:chromosome segregation ATPase